MWIRRCPCVLVAAICMAVPVGAQQARAPQRRPLVLPQLPALSMDRKIELSTVTGAPYSADVTSESIQTLSDGNRIVKRTTGKVYRDSVGRVRREETRPDGTVEISIHDPVANTVTMLDSGDRTARVTPGLGRYTLRSAVDGRVMTYTMTLNAARPYRADATKEAGTEHTTSETLPERSLEGVRVTGIRKTTTIAAGAVGNEQPIHVVSEEWTSPDLKVLVLTDFNDPRSVRTTYKLTNITRDHPDASLFLVPSGYRKR